MGGCLSSQAGGEAAERGQAGKQQYAKNKVVPEPTSNTNGTAANAAAQATAANGIMGPIDVGLQEVVTLCASISPKTLAASTPALAQAQHKLTQQLQALKPAQALASAAAAAQACSRCIDSIMAPVLTATEKALGGGEDTGSQPQWDSISPHQLLSSIEKAISTAYPDHSQSPAAQVKAVAEMLHQLKHYANSQGSPLAPAATVVHSVGQLATMMCLIFFRRVTVETQVGQVVMMQTIPSPGGHLPRRSYSNVICSQSHLCLLLVAYRLLWNLRLKQSTSFKVSWVGNNSTWLPVSALTQQRP
jgi:hypothetical protein